MDNITNIIKQRFLTKVTLLAFLLFSGLSETAFAQTTTYSYDALGRVIAVASDIKDDRTYEYDNGYRNQ